MTTLRIHGAVDKCLRLVPALALLWAALVMLSPAQSVVGFRHPWTVHGA